MNTDVQQVAKELVCNPAARLALKQYAAQLRQRSPATLDRYQRTLTAFFSHLIETQTPLEAIDNIVLERYASLRYARAKAALGADEPARPGESKTAARVREQTNQAKRQQAQDRVNREFDVINAFVRAMIDAGSLDRSPGLTGFRYRSPDAKVSARTAPTTLSDDKWFPGPLWERLGTGLQAAIAGTKSTRDFRYFRRWEYRIAILYGLGLRASEAIDHSYADLSEKHGLPTLTVIGKGRKAREIPVDRVTSEAMAEYLRSLNLDFAAAAQLRLPLIPGREPSRPPSRHSLYTGFQTLQERLDWATHERRELHALRHTRATHLAAVLTLAELMKFLGHSRAETTQIYFHSNADMLARMNNLRHAAHLDARMGTDRIPASTEQSS